MYTIVDQPIRSTQYLDELKRLAVNSDTEPSYDGHWYHSGQSWRNMDKDAVYATFSNHREETRVFIAEFDNPTDAGYAAAALNRARPFEYSIIDFITATPQPQRDAVDPQRRKQSVLYPSTMLTNCT